MDYDKRAVGRRIQQRRKAKKLTQIKLDEKIGKASPYIADIERGAAGMSVETMLSICEQLDTTPNYILLGINGDESASASQIEQIQQLLSGLSEQQIDGLIQVMNSVINML